jgi:hypothetical protein
MSYAFVLFPMRHACSAYLTRLCKRKVPSNCAVFQRSIRDVRGLFLQLGFLLYKRALLCKRILEACTVISSVQRNFPCNYLHKKQDYMDYALHMSKCILAVKLLEFFKVVVFGLWHREVIDRIQTF